MIGVLSLMRLSFIRLFRESPGAWFASRAGGGHYRRGVPQEALGPCGRLGVQARLSRVYGQ